MKSHSHWTAVLTVVVCGLLFWVTKIWMTTSRCSKKSILVHDVVSTSFKILAKSLISFFLAWVFNAKRFSTWDSIFLGTMLWIFLFYFVGFIMMTPQLFINYKMKSVAHLPWRMMTYKALNTFIDDLFAFVIKMPTLYRLGCFRDGKDNYATKHVQIITFFGTFIKVRNPEVLFCNSVKSP